MGLRLYVDERGDADQRAALEAIITGRLGGTPLAQFPWAFKESRQLAVRAVPIEVDHQARRGWFRAGEYVSVRVGDPVADQEPVTCVIPGHDRKGTERHGELLRVSDGPLASSSAGAAPTRARSTTPHEERLTGPGTREHDARDRRSLAKETPWPGRSKAPYFETCSCEVVCPCTASLALGADYDCCRVTLVFHVTDGEVDGTDVGGLTVAAVADTPKVMTDGNWRLGVFIDDGRLRRAGREARRRVQRRSWAGRWRRSAPLIGENLGRRARADRGPRGGACATASGSATRSTSRSRTWSRSASSPASRRGSTGIFHPAGSELTIAQGDALEHRRVRDRYEGKVGLLHLELRLGRLR